MHLRSGTKATSLLYLLSHTFVVYPPLTDAVSVTRSGRSAYHQAFEQSQSIAQTLNRPTDRDNNRFSNMAKEGEMTEINLVPIEDNSSGHSSLDRPSRTDTSPTYANSNSNRASNFSYPQAKGPAPAYHQQRYSYVDDTPGGSPPGTPITGGGGATPYGSLLPPPKYPSYANSNGADTRSSSPFPQSQTAFVSDL